MKKTRFLTTYLTLAVLGGLAATFYFVGSKPEPEKTAKPREKVLAFEKAKIKELRLEPAGGEAVRLVKEANSWRMTAPFTAPADSGEADSLVGSLESLEVEEVAAESPADLKEFGLDAPRTTVALLQDGASEPLKLLVGEKTPDGGSVYAKLPTQPRVFTIAAYLRSSLDKKPFDLRDRDVLHVKRDAVKTLEIAGPEGDYALSRTDKGEWRFTRPLETSAGRWSVDSLLGLLESLRMESIATEDGKDLKKFGLDKPSRTVALLLDGGARKTLEIGKIVEEASDRGSATDAGKKTPAAGGKKVKASSASAKGERAGAKEAKNGAGTTGTEGAENEEGAAAKPGSPPKPVKYYAREAGSPLVAVVTGALVGDLAKGMKELRAKRLLEIATYEVVGVDVEAGGVKKTYARSSTKDKDGMDLYKWKRTSPDTADIDTNKVQDALFLVGGVEVQEFQDSPSSPAAYGLDRAALRVSLRHEGGKPPSWFEVGEKDGSFYAKRPEDHAILKLDAAKAAELLKKFKEL